jgi:hypothetical protein
MVSYTSMNIHTYIYIYIYIRKVNIQQVGICIHINKRVRIGARLYKQVLVYPLNLGIQISKAGYD